MYVSSGTCDHPATGKMTYHWTLFPEKNYVQVLYMPRMFRIFALNRVYVYGCVQLQLLSADGSTVFALAAHRELQLSFLQKYGFVIILCALCVKKP